MKQLSKMSERELIEEYVLSAVKGAEAVEQGESSYANKATARVVAVFHEFERRGEPQVHLLTLLQNSRPEVRVWAASHLLEYEPERAEVELQHLASTSPGFLRLTAEVTLERWRNKQ